MNPLLTLLVASIIVLVSAILATPLQIGPLILSVVSILFNVGTMYLKANKPQPLARTLFKIPKAGTPVSLELFLAFVLFATWAVGAGIFTFVGPFTTTSNGYFAVVSLTHPANEDALPHRLLLCPLSLGPLHTRSSHDRHSGAP
jgi:hypothetical protein